MWISMECVDACRPRSPSFLDQIRNCDGSGKDAMEIMMFTEDKGRMKTYHHISS